MIPKKVSSTINPFHPHREQFPQKFLPIFRKKLGELVTKDVRVLKNLNYL